MRSCVCVDVYQLVCSLLEVPSDVHLLIHLNEVCVWMIRVGMHGLRCIIDTMNQLMMEYERTNEQQGKVEVYAGSIKQIANRIMVSEDNKTETLAMSSG